MTILLACSFDDDEWADWLPCLQAALPGETWHRAEDAAALTAAERAAVDIAIVANPQPGQLTGYPALRLIQSLWAGVDRLLADTSLPRDVALARMVDPGMTAAMAETALWAVLSLHRGYYTYARQQAQRRWQQWPQRRADEVQVLVAGAGELGLAVSERLLGQGYRVATWGRTARTRVLSASSASSTSHAAQAAQANRWQTAHGPAAWAELAGQADVVINLLPLTPDTRGWFDAARLAGFKPGAGFVNLARGAAVVDADLLAALDSGQLGHAVLDVHTHEPLPADHPAWRHPRVTVLPHVAALTDPRSAAPVAAANVLAMRLAARSRGTAAEPALIGQVDRRRGY
jgi:glyoxylate/hydroxypyruvate reductase A